MPRTRSKPDPPPTDLEMVEVDHDDLYQEESPKQRKGQKETGNDSVRDYLVEIGQVPLLKAHQEIELSRQIQQAIALEAIRDALTTQLGQEPSLSQWAEAANLTEAALKRAIAVSQRAKDKMISANLRLVVSIAKRYMNRGVPFQDLIQEGSLGLIRAAEKFDPEKGYKFSTYATWWVRQAVTRGVAEKSRTIRLPVHLYEKVNQIKKATKLLSQELGRKPTEEELATRMEMTVDRLRFIAHAVQVPRSLDQTIKPHSHRGEEGDTTLGDLIASTEAEPETDVDRQLLRDNLEGLLSTLDPRQRDVLRMRYGLDNGQAKTLEEVGQIFNVTRERIRQIEAKALRQLRRPHLKNQLEGHLEES